MTDAELLEMARKCREVNGFPDDELDRQIRSFAYGNTHLANSQITRADIDAAVDALHSSSHPTKSDN